MSESESESEDAVEVSESESSPSSESRRRRRYCRRPAGGPGASAHPPAVVPDPPSSEGLPPSRPSMMIYPFVETLRAGGFRRVGRGTSRDRYLMKLTWDGEVAWTRSMPAHHDVEETSSGRLLTLTLWIGRPARRNHDIRNDRLALLSPTGEPLETVSLYDLLSREPDRFPLQTVRPRTDAEGRTYVDLFHSNSVEWNRST